jgi:hypothetical protein
MGIDGFICLYVYEFIGLMRLMRVDEVDEG